MHREAVGFILRVSFTSAPVVRRFERRSATPLLQQTWYRHFEFLPLKLFLHQFLPRVSNPARHAQVGSSWIESRFVAACSIQHATVLVRLVRMHAMQRPPGGLAALSWLRVLTVL